MFDLWNRKVSEDVFQIGNIGNMGEFEFCMVICITNHVHFAQSHSNCPGSSIMVPFKVSNTVKKVVKNISRTGASSESEDGDLDMDQFLAAFAAHETKDTDKLISNPDKREKRRRKCEYCSALTSTECYHPACRSKPQKKGRHSTEGRFICQSCRADHAKDLMNHNIT